MRSLWTSTTPIFEATIAEVITQIPAYAEKDDFALVMTQFEWIGFGHGRLPV